MKLDPSSLTTGLQMKSKISLLAKGSQMITQSESKKKGFYLPLILTTAAVLFIVTGSIISLGYGNFQAVKKQGNSNSALNVAESGINYYLWHLSHNDTDYCDGQVCNGPGPYGPYVHDYYDTSNNPAGSYSITITPPVSGGNAVTVQSVGTSITGENRTIQATLGIPSFAQYSFVSNSEAWFGDTESTNGLVHSNKGIHFDGTASGVVAAAVQTYTPSSCFGGNGTVKNGVWGTGGPTSYWTFPVPQIDFNQITSDLNILQTAAQANGIYLPTQGVNANQKSVNGYALQLNANGTVRVGRVTSRRDNGGLGGSCVNHPRYNSLMQTVTWEPSARALPSNGVIFVADNAWVWGTVTSRLTIASGRFPDSSTTNTNIFLQDSLNYTVKDGSVALGLISQSDIVVNSSSADNLNLDAYLLSQKGKVFRPYYSGNVKSTITTYGGIAANSWWTWSWVNGSNQVISGYQTTSSSFDNYLTLNPPPLFPKTGSFAVLSWKEEPIL